MQLTEEQREFVAENHNLIYSFARKRGLDLEEYYGLLAIGLCKAGCMYDAERDVKFSVFAYTCMYNECKIYWRNMMSPTHIPEDMICSYNEPLFLGDDEPCDLGMLDALKDLRTNPDVSKLYVDEFIASLDERKQKILTDYMNGHSGREIGKSLGLSYTIIYRALDDIGKLWWRYEKTANFDVVRLNNKTILTEKG